MSQAEDSTKRNDSRSKSNDSEQKASGSASKSTQSSTSGSEKQGTGSTGKASGQEAMSASMTGVQEQAEHLVDTARQQARGQIGSQKDRLAGSLGIVADALHTAGDQVRDKNDEMMAGYLDSAADRVDEFANALRDQDVTGLARTVERFGREQPGILLAATFGLGFAAARFLKSSTRSSSSRYQGSWSGGDRGSWSGGSWDRSPARGLGRFGVGDYSAAYAAGVGSGYGSAYGSPSADAYGSPGRYGGSEYGDSGAGAGGYASSGSGAAGIASYGSGTSGYGASERDRSPRSGSGAGRDASAGWRGTAPSGTDETIGGEWSGSAFDTGPEGQ
jgi:hypothetical protein